MTNDGKMMMGPGDKVLASGRVINLEAVFLGEQELTLHDISSQLSVIPRFGGMLARPVSVAEHSIAVARAAMEMRPRLSGWQVMMALLHDAAEVVIGDIDRPAKWLVGGTEGTVHKIEAAVLAQIVSGLFSIKIENVPPLMDSKDGVAAAWWAPIKHLDDRALNAEWLHFMPAAIRDNVDFPMMPPPLQREFYFAGGVAGGADEDAARAFRKLFHRILREYLGLRPLRNGKFSLEESLIDCEGPF